MTLRHIFLQAATILFLTPGLSNAAGFQPVSTDFALDSSFSGRWSTPATQDDRKCRILSGAGGSISVPVWWGDSLRPATGTAFRARLVYKDVLRRPAPLRTLDGISRSYSLFRLGGLADGQWKTAIIPMPWDMVYRSPGKTTTSVYIDLEQNPDAQLPVASLTIEEGNPAEDEARWAEETRAFVAREQAAARAALPVAPADTAAIPDGLKSQPVIPYARSPRASIRRNNAPQPGEAGAPVRLVMALNEIECGQFGVYANGSDLRSVKVSLTPTGLCDTNGTRLDAVIELFAAEYSLLGENKLQLLPSRLWRAYPVDIATGTSHMFWINVETRSETARAGIYRGNIIIDSSGTPSSGIVLEVEVRPIRLLTVNEAGITFAGCNNCTFPVHELAEMARHNQSSFAIWYQSSHPELTKGKGSVEMDLAPWNLMMKSARGLGFQNFVYFLGGEPMKFPDTLHLQRDLYMRTLGRTRQEYESAAMAAPERILPELKPLYRDWVRQFMQNARTENWPEPLLTPFDEPAKWAEKDKGYLKPQFKELCAIIHDAAPGARIYAAIHNETNGLVFMDDVDVFCSNRLLQDQTLGDKVRAAGKTFWAYRGGGQGWDCGWQRYWYGFFFSAYGANGTLNYASNWSQGPEDPAAPGTVWSTPYSVVRSALWDGIREAMDDRRYMETLRSAGKAAGRVDEVEALLKSISERAIAANPDLPVPKSDTPDKKRAREECLDEWRLEIAAKIMELQKPPATAQAAITTAAAVQRNDGAPAKITLPPGVPVPPPGHPRLYLRPDDLPGMQKRLNDPRIKPLWDQYKDSDLMCMALNYVVTKDETVAAALRTQLSAKRIIEGVRTVDGLRMSGDPQKFTYWPHQSAILYDWCHDLLTPEQRKTFVDSATNFWGPNGEHNKGGLPVGSPDLNCVVGHAVEAWVHCGALPAGVAIYEDWPGLYAAVADHWINRMMPAENYYYQSMWHHQGATYSTYRFVHPLLATYMMEHMTGQKFADIRQRQIPYQTIYHTRPTGFRSLTYGDSHAGVGATPGNGLPFIILGNVDRNPYFTYAVNHVPILQYPMKGSEFPPFMFFLFHDPDVQERPLTELPLTRYFPDPQGIMLARTGWNFGPDSRDALVFMKIGRKHFCNHNHLDAGTFQIYYRGYLAMKSGYLTRCGDMYYDNYFHRTVSENALLIHDPSEKMTGTYGHGNSNDGGQREHGEPPVRLSDITSGLYDTGDILAHDSGPDTNRPEFTYLAGDITPAYTPAKVKQVTRSMVFFRTENVKYPGIFVTFDRITSTKPEFRKTWLLHCEQEPAITEKNGRQEIVVTHTGPDPSYQAYLKDPKAATRQRPENNVVNMSSGDLVYNGRLTVQPLLPARVSINKISGFVVDGVDTTLGLPGPGENGRDSLLKTMREQLTGPWRVEISPAQPSESDILLNVMTLMDADNDVHPAATLIESEVYAGASILDKAVLFSRSRNLQSGAEFTLTGQGEFGILVCDLNEGSYEVSVNGNNAGNFSTAGGEGRCLYFKGQPGKYMLRKTQ